MAEPAKYTLEDKMQDAADAFLRAERYHAELRDIWTYFAPFREPTNERALGHGGKMEGDKRIDRVFDSTGISSLYSFVANMKADWMPAFEPFFSLQNGPLFGGEKDALSARNTALQAVATTAHALLRPVQTKADEMFADLFAGTGAMVLGRGNSRQPIRGVAVPTREIALAVGPWGDIERWFWKRTYKARHIPELWPKAKISDQLAHQIKNNRNADIEVTQYTYWDAEKEDFGLCVWTAADHRVPLWEERMSTSPWVTPRMFVVPGEAMGRGLAHLGLPNVRTLNKSRELALRAAAFALLGLWTRRNDGVFNPETAVMSPGVMWKVGSNAAGGLGPSLQRLDIPHNFDISSVIIEDEREQLRRVLLDDELPELSDRVRSPTEIAGRMRRYDRNRGGATTRLAVELVQPIVQRTVDLMAQQGMLPEKLTIDQMLTEVVVSAPAALAQRSDKLERITSYIQIVGGLFGPQAVALNAKIEELIPEMARYAGLDEKFIRTKTESDQLQALIDQAVQAAVAQERAAQKAAPAQPAPAEPPPPGQDFVTGGMLQ
jgi:hypothetical protein